MPVYVHMCIYMCICVCIYTHTYISFPGGSEAKVSACSVRDLGLFPELGRSPGEGTATYSSILAWRIPMDRGAWQATVYGVARVEHD